MFTSGVQSSRRISWPSSRHESANHQTAVQQQILTGRWLVEDGRARADATCERIEWLIAHQLQEVADSPHSGAWETLYRDPDDGRYWERTYPHTEMHAGGPPQLKCLTFQEANKKYRASVVAP